MKAEYDLSKMKSRKNPYAAQLKQQSVYIGFVAQISQIKQNL